MMMMITAKNLCYYYCRYNLIWQSQNYPLWRK